MAAPSRRTFLKTSASTLAAGAAALNAHAAGSETIRVGLVGCGNRGTGAAEQALSADKDVQLVAMADAFPDKISRSLKTLENQLGNAYSAKVNVAPERRFSGFDAYKRVIEQSDVVLLATPPGFRPMHLKAAVEAGKHVFCEKPMAVDGPGVRSVMKTAELAKQKKTCLVSGFCYRYEPSKRETVKRIHDGAIGDVLSVNVNYNTGTLWSVPRTPAMTDMEWQVRNWYYFTWLSGDHIVEQHIHSLDKAAWVLKDTYPVSAIGMGGRQVRTDPLFGHIYDHHAVVFDYADGRKVFSFTRQMQKCANDTSDYVIGSKGTAELMKHVIKGATDWRYRDPSVDMYQVEHNELFAAIRAGKLINDGDFMAKSTLMGILGRMATYTGQRVTWDKALNSEENLMPAKLDWSAAPPSVVVAMPGVTKVV